MATQYGRLDALPLRWSCKWSALRRNPKESTAFLSCCELMTWPLIRKTRVNHPCQLLSSRRKMNALSPAVAEF